MKKTKRYIAFFLVLLMLFSSVCIGFAADENICTESVLENPDFLESEQNEATVNEEEMESVTGDEAEDLVFDDSQNVDSTSDTVWDMDNSDSINSETETQDSSNLNEDSENNSTSEIVKDGAEVSTEDNITETYLPENSDDNLSKIEDIVSNDKVDENNIMIQKARENISLQNECLEINEISETDIIDGIFVSENDEPVINGHTRWVYIPVSNGDENETADIQFCSITSDHTYRLIDDIDVIDPNGFFDIYADGELEGGYTSGYLTRCYLYITGIKVTPNPIYFYVEYWVNTYKNNWVKYTDKVNVIVYEPDIINISQGDTYHGEFRDDVIPTSDAYRFEDGFQALMALPKNIITLTSGNKNLNEGFDIVANMLGESKVVGYWNHYADSFRKTGGNFYGYNNDICYLHVTRFNVSELQIINYTVIYTDGVDGDIIFPDQTYEEVKEGDETPKYTEEYGYTETLEDGTVIPKREGYTFMGWTPVVTDTINSYMANDDNEIIYTATWLKDETTYPYKVVYTDGVNGTVFADETYSTLDEGSATPSFTKNLNRKGYKFIGWKLVSVDSNKTGIQPTVKAEDANSDRTIIYEAQWEEIKYIIGWYDEDKLTQLDKNTFLEDEEEPSYSKELPTKEEDDKYTYIFKEWVLQETPLNEDNISYVASYTPIPKKYGYTIEHQYYTDGELDGSEIISASVELDEIIDSSDFEVVENYKDNIYQFSSVAPSEIKITVSEEDNKMIFRYDRFSYKVIHQYLNETGDLDGQTDEVLYSVEGEEIKVDSIEHKTIYNEEIYPYVSDSGNLIISNNVADNVITITYQKEKQLPKETTYTVKWLDTEEDLLKQETRTGFVEETKVPSESDYMIDGYTFLPKYKDNILSVILKEDSSENVLILYFSKHQEKEEFGSYEIEHQYYVKDKNGNLKLEGTVKETISNIKVGTIIVSSSIAKKYHYGNNVYEFLSAGDNIVIEKDSHLTLVLKYLRTEQEDTNITITEENKPILPEKDEPVEEVKPKEEVVVIQEENTTTDNSEQVKTGDSSNILVYGFLLTLSVLGICFLKKKK